MILLKLGSFMFYRDTVFNLIRFAEKHFWGSFYDESGAQILEAYDKLGMKMVYTFTVIVYVATFNYIFAPFFGTILVSCSALTRMLFREPQSSQSNTASRSQRNFHLLYYK